MPNTYTSLAYHIIFSTKGRAPFITSAIAPQLHAYLAGIIKNLHGVPIQIGGMPDHVHIVCRSKPGISISDMLRTIKASSSKWVNETMQTPHPFAWQTGYGAFTVSESRLDSVVSYVKNQAEHHRTRTFQEEFIEFLERNKVAYDERYLWE